MEAVTYIRALSCMPGDEMSLAEREEKILKYAASHGIEITKSYTDAEETHTASDGFTRLLEDGARRRFDHVLIDSVFAAGRDVTAAKYVLLGTFFPAGIHFTAVSDGFTSRGKTVDEVESYFKAAHYKLLGCKKAERNAALASPGGRRPTYGFRKEDGVMVVDEAEAETVRRIFRMRLDGVGPEKIIRTLEEEEIPSPTGNCPWYRQLIRQILRDRMYIDEKYGPIIEPNMFDEVQRRFPERNPVAAAAIDSEPDEGEILALLKKEHRLAARTAERIQKDEDVRERLMERTRKEAQNAAMSIANAHAAKMEAYQRCRDADTELTRRELKRLSEELDRKIRETEAVLTECTAAEKNIPLAASADNPWLKLYTSWDGTRKSMYYSAKRGGLRETYWRDLLLKGLDPQEEQA